MLTVALALFFSQQLTFAQALDVQDRVRVRTDKSKQVVRVSGFGLRLQGDGIVLRTDILPKKQILTVTRQSGGWSVVDSAPSGQKVFYSGSELRINGEMIRVGSEAAANHLWLVSNGLTFDVIAELDVEDYLKGVLPSEMPMQWPIEALKAQAVAARSYVLAFMRERRNEVYHVDDSIQHQVFRLQNYTEASFEFREKIEKALIETRGVYLANAAGLPYKTFFHSDCGGQTEEPKFIWGMPGRYGTVKDEQCSLNTLSQWHANIAGDELNQKLLDKLAIPNYFKLERLSIATNTDSGRIHELRFQFRHLSDSSQGELLRVMNAQDFRELFGFNRIKSTSFSFQLSSNGLELKGRGHGHGAGLCQKGARFMALAGSNYLDIVKRYYPVAKLQRPALIASAKALAKD